MVPLCLVLIGGGLRAILQAMSATMQICSQFALFALPRGQSSSVPSSAPHTMRRPSVIVP